MVQKAISDKSNLTVSLSYLVQIIGAICAVVYTYVSLTAEITSLENQVVLMQEDLKKFRSGLEIGSQGEFYLLM